MIALVVGLAAGCAEPAAAERQAAAPGQALVHVHEFPGSGRRLGPPTGRPALTREQAIRTSTVRGFFSAGPPPEVRLADYTSRFRDPVRALVWVAVDPEHASFESGPDLRPATDGAGRCPLYVVVDAASGRGYGAWQTCDPPYRG